MNFFYISRIRVEGGFLDGMDISLESGLNTIIGARGTGKSSIVELIRYCLNIQGNSLESNQKSLSHARSVLGDGQITIYISNDNDTYSYTRSFDDESSITSISEINRPLIFSQTEIENIGLTSQGRLKLIDDFLFEIKDIDIKEKSQIAIIHSFSSEIISLRISIDDVEDKLLAIPNVKKELQHIQEEEKKISKSSEIAELKSIEINKISDKHIEINKSIRNYNEINSSVLGLDQILDNFLEKEKNILELLKNDEIIENELKLVSEKILEVKNKLEFIIEKNINSLNRMNSELSEINRKGVELRSEFDLLQQGAGEVARKRQYYLQLFSELEEINKVNLEKENKIKELKIKRDHSIENLNILRKNRTELRIKKCQDLNLALKPKIKVSVEIESQLDEYQQVLINSLKGSGIKYNEIVPIICESLPPLILLRIIEDNDIDSFTSFIFISKERASKIISALKNSVDKISTVLLDDEIKFELLDGSEYKELSNLSTGQRCTVILPIILEHINNTLIIDQPEDHIDNAFVVDTLVSSILRRSGKGQIIVTTHNANLPVLGNAEKVIHLNSDGTRGFVVANGNLEDINIINAISNVMEGGREAFLRRAKFYG
ncbi:AAA family ATPase [Acinetobacter proteolyticus]|uniref:AAA family ATPase n=1 Tax=Acinetobacter proteolyticus TaxID=1776741 RepID=UPI0031D743A4